MAKLSLLAWLDPAAAQERRFAALAGLQVNAQRMRANLDTLRAELPPEAADEWFNADLAQHAAGLARARVQALRQLNDKT